MKEQINEIINNMNQLSYNQIREKLSDIVNNLNQKEEVTKEKEKVLQPIIERANDYFYIDDTEIVWNEDNYSHIDDDRVEKFNYFLSEAEAEEFKVRQDLFRKVIRVRDFVNGEWKFDVVKMQNKDEWDYYIIDIDSDGFIDSYNKEGGDWNNDQIFALPLTFESEEKLELFRKYVTDEEIKTFLLI